jgi:NADPH:quinone reductase-like Zn-dependent oxidoreductase
VQGGAGAVGACAVQLAHHAGARVIATCRAESDKEIASRAGADEVLLTGENLVKRIWALAPDGVHHIVEVAFGANIKTDIKVLAQVTWSLRGAVSSRAGVAFLREVVPFLKRKGGRRAAAETLDLLLAPTIVGRTVEALKATAIVTRVTEIPWSKKQRRREWDSFSP